MAKKSTRKASTTPTATRIEQTRFGALEPYQQVVAMHMALVIQSEFPDFDPIEFVTRQEDAITCIGVTIMELDKLRAAGWSDLQLVSMLAGLLDYRKTNSSTSLAAYIELYNASPQPDVVCAAPVVSTHPAEFRLPTQAAAATAPQPVVDDPGIAQVMHGGSEVTLSVPHEVWQRWNALLAPGVFAANAQSYPHVTQEEPTIEELPPVEFLLALADNSDISATLHTSLMCDANNRPYVDMFVKCVEKSIPYLMREAVPSVVFQPMSVLLSSAPDTASELSSLSPDITVHVDVLPVVEVKPAAPQPVARRGMGVTVAPVAQAPAPQPALQQRATAPVAQPQAGPVHVSPRVTPGPIPAPAGNKIAHPPVQSPMTGLAPNVPQTVITPKNGGRTMR